MVGSGQRESIGVKSAVWGYVRGGRGCFKGLESDFDERFELIRRVIELGDFINVLI